MTSLPAILPGVRQQDASPRCRKTPVRANFLGSALVWQRLRHDSARPPRASRQRAGFGKAAARRQREPLHGPRVFPLPGDVRKQALAPHGPSCSASNAGGGHERKPAEHQGQRLLQYATRLPLPKSLAPGCKRGGRRPREKERDTQNRRLARKCRLPR